MVTWWSQNLIAIYRRKQKRYLPTDRLSRFESIDTPRQAVLIYGFCDTGRSQLGAESDGHLVAYGFVQDRHIHRRDSFTAHTCKHILHELRAKASMIAAWVDSDLITEDEPTALFCEEVYSA